MPTLRTSSLNSGPQRLDQVELHVLGEPAHVVVALDLGGAGGARLDDVGVERALDQELGVLDAAGDALEDADEQLADGLALVLGVGDALELLEVAVGGAHVDELDALVALEGLDDLLALAEAHEPGVDEHAGQLGPDGLVHERGGHGGVDAAGEGADDLGVADLLADEVDLGVDDRAHDPRRRAAAHVVEQVLEHGLAVGRVDHLGVELHGVDLAGRRPPWRRRARRAWRR